MTPPDDVFNDPPRVIRDPFVDESPDPESGAVRMPLYGTGFEPEPRPSRVPIRSPFDTDFDLPDGTAPGIPTNVQVAYGSGGLVFVSWMAVANAEGYVLLDAQGGIVTVITPGAATLLSAYLAAGTYKIHAYNAVGRGPGANVVVT